MQERRTIWILWARFQGLAAALCLLFGGGIGLIFPIKWIPILSMILAPIVAALELPMPGIERLRPLTTTLWLRGLFYLGAAAPLFLAAATTTGALGLAATGVTYLIASFRGESWQHPRDWLKENATVLRSQQSSRQPSPTNPSTMHIKVESSSLSRDPFVLPSPKMQRSNSDRFPPSSPSRSLSRPSLTRQPPLNGNSSGGGGRSYSPASSRMQSSYTAKEDYGRRAVDTMYTMSPTKF